MENGSNEDDTGTAAVKQLPGEQLGRELAVPGSRRSSPSLLVSDTAVLLWASGKRSSGRTGLGKAAPSKIGRAHV